MTIVSVSIPDNLLGKADHSMKEEGFASRSEMVRQAIRAYIAEARSLRELEGEIAATITIIFEREATKGRISDIQHSFGDIISTFLHAHIDEDYCLEVIVVKGDANIVRKLVDAFRTSEQIAQIKVAVLKESKI